MSSTRAEVTVPTFQAMPSSSQWKKKSSEILSFRSSDTVLGQIDDLVKRYWQQAESRLEIEYQLYRALLYWSKNVGTKFKGDSDRRPAVDALAAFIERDFSTIFEVDASNLPELLTVTFGKPVHIAYEDTEVFNTDRTVEYITDETERRKFKLIFRKGLAYKRTTTGLVRYDTATDVGKDGEQGEAIFVMDANGRIYTGSYSRGMFHHSSFLAGGWSLAAGTMRVDNGQIVKVAPDSGHYQPGLQQMLNLTERLRSYGVNLRRLTVNLFIYETDGPFKGQAKQKAGLFVWDSFRGDTFLATRGRR